MILADTSVLIDFFKKNENASVKKFKEAIRLQIPFGITSQIFQEILQGARSQKDYDQLKSYLKTQIFYHPKDSIKSYAQAAEIYRKCRQKGITPRSAIDCMIAQITIENNLYLLHNDNDFSRMANIIGLKIY